MHVHDSGIRHESRGFDSKQRPGPIAVQSIHAVHNLRLRLGEALSQSPSQKEMLGRARPPPLAQHPIDAAIARPTVIEESHGFHQLDQRRVMGSEGIYVLASRSHATSAIVKPS
jgi:hypothetical protein